jgi:predicted metal-dependent hydrolase
VYLPTAKRLVEHDNWLALPATKSDIEIVKIICKWLKQKSESYIAPVMLQLSNATGLKYKKLTFRGQKTRWGSCSPTGSVNLNYCLLFLPEKYVRYVLIHELCHLQELNHSQAFWQLVKSFEPKYKHLDKKLNDYWVNLPAWLDQRFDKPNKDQELIILDF